MREDLLNELTAEYEAQRARNDREEGIHAQAAYVSDEEINSVIAFLRRENEAIQDE